MFDDLKSIDKREVNELKNDLKREQEEYVISFQKLRILIGVIGMSFPLILFFGLFVYNIFLQRELIFLSSFGVTSLYALAFYYFIRIKSKKGINYLFVSLVILFFIYLIMLFSYDGLCNIPSISDYYHTKVGSLFIGVLVAISVFLYAYRGETNAEERLCTRASVLCLCIAFFPTDQMSNTIVSNDNYNYEIFSMCYDPALPNHSFIGIIHLICAALFFYILSNLILNHFILKEEELNYDSEGKSKRIMMYKMCGYGIRLMLALLVLNFLLELLFPQMKAWPIVYILELFALWFFGLAWLIKGELILRRNSIILQIDDE